MWTFFVTNEIHGTNIFYTTKLLGSRYFCYIVSLTRYDDEFLYIFHFCPFLISYSYSGTNYCQATIL